MRSWFWTVTAIFAVMAGGTSSVQGATRTWSNSTRGSFTAAANWSPAAVPGSADLAVFRRGAGDVYTTTFPGKINFPLPVYGLDRVLVGNNTVTFEDSLGISQFPGSVSLTNPTLSLAGRALVVGESDTDTAAVLNTSLANFSTVAALLGDAPESSGTLNVTDGVLSITGSSNSDDELIVGKQGYGELNISGGGRVNVLGSAGSVVTSRFEFDLPTPTEPAQSRISIHGAGSQLNIGSSLYVGFAATSEVTVAAGGLLTTNTATIGEFNSFAIVEGAGSRWENAGNFAIGETTTAGAFGLLIRDGGSVAAGGTIAVNDALVGVNGTVEGDVVNHKLVGAGTSTFGGIGNLRITGDYQQNGILQIYAVNSTNVSKLQVDGHTTLNPISSSLSVQFSSDPMNRYEFGDAIDIVDWNGTVTGTFNSISLPPLIVFLAWNTTQLYTTGVLSVGYRGDFDFDGDVDGRDFLIWQRGGSPTALNASDLADWQGNYGVGTVTAEATAVPEPCAGILALFLGLGFCMRRVVS